MNDIESASESVTDSDSSSKRPGGEAYDRSMSPEESVPEPMCRLQDEINQVREVAESANELSSENVTLRKQADLAIARLFDEQEQLVKENSSQQIELEALKSEDAKIISAHNKLITVHNRVKKICDEREASQSQKQQAVDTRIEKVNQELSVFSIDCNNRLAILQKQYESLHAEHLPDKQQRLEEKLNDQIDTLHNELQCLKSDQQRYKEQHDKKIEDLFSHIRSHQGDIKRHTLTYDALYKEVSEFKNTKEVQDSNRSLFLGFYDDFQRDLTHLKETRNETLTVDVEVFLKELENSAVHILEHLDLEKIVPAPDKYTDADANWIHTLGTEPTDKPEEDGMISEWKKDAFRRKDGHVFRKAQVIIKKYKGD